MGNKLSFGEQSGPLSFGEQTHLSFGEQKGAHLSFGEQNPLEAMATTDKASHTGIDHVYDQSCVA
jgi:hypothetical protein